MIGITSGSEFTKLKLHQISGKGRRPEIKEVSGPVLTTRVVPFPLVRNLMSLHESAAPGAVKGFTKTIFKVGLMDELLSDAVESRSAASSPSKRVDMKNPERVMEAFYAASFLQNEEASECLVYSHEGRVVGMAQIGNFGRAAPGLECTISNLILSPKLDVETQSSVIRHVADAAKARTGEATLLTPEPWGPGYKSHGFTIEKAGPAAEFGARDPLASSIIREARASLPQDRENVVRCRWSM